MIPNDSLATHVVLYYEAGDAGDDLPLGFVCEADDIDHAEEQCENANPDCDVVFARKGGILADALAEYCKE